MEPLLRGNIFLDANLLLLLVIGSTDRTLIREFKRTQEFSEQDFDSLAEIVSQADKIRTTPHILTEVSNLANALPEHKKEDFALVFRTLIAAFDESFTRAAVLSLSPLFHFGIADVSMLVASASMLILTEDGRFAHYVNALGGTAFDLKTAIALRGKLL